MEPALEQHLKTLVSENRVVLFMKGNRRMPQCGFSATVVGILDGLIDEYETVDVLKSPDIRQGIKEFSEWPTLPQLYVDGEFLGGCDIIREMAGSGDLHKALGIQLEDVEPPNMEVTEPARAALAQATADLDGEWLRFKVPANYRYELTLGPRMFGDVEVEANGITILLDRASAQRAEGTVIDYEKNTMGEGFRIENPNEPPKVKQISAQQLRERLDGGDVTLFDVRTQQERETAVIESALWLDEAGKAQLASLDKSSPIVFHCHHGARSQQAAEQALAQGFTDVMNLQGGIDAWSTQVDGSVPRY